MKPPLPSQEAEEKPKEKDRGIDGIGHHSLAGCDVVGIHELRM